MDGRKLSLENLESRTLLTTLFVTSDADSGAGTFREAIETANSDSEIERIAFKDNVAIVELESSLHYSGSQDLVINGRGANVTTTADTAGSFDLLISSGDANMRLRDIGLTGGARGFHAAISDEAIGEISFHFRDVSVQDNALFGIHLDDLTHESDASLRLMIRDSIVSSNGNDEFENDGVRVEEGGIGGIQARIVDTLINENAANGVALDENGDGRAWLFAKDSSFNENGTFGEETLGDGLNIHEAGSGDLWVRAAGSTFNNNADQGMDLTEEIGGFARVHLFKVSADNNINEGVSVQEKYDDEVTGSEGNLFAHFLEVSVKNNENGPGISLSEEGSGALFAHFVRVNASENGHHGARILEYGDGNLRSIFHKVDLKLNVGDGADLSESGEGNYLGLAVDLESTGNEGFGVRVTQESEEGDWGRLKVNLSDLSDNLLGEFEAIDVTVK